MGRSQQTFNKKENEKKKQKKKLEKQKKKEARQATSDKGKSFDDMIAYTDEFGNIVSTPPDPSEKEEVKVEDIQYGVPKQEKLDDTDLIRNGVITFFNDAKGFGFIQDDKTGESIFVHINNASGPITKGNKVTFEVEQGPRGYNAVNVNLSA